MLVHHAGRNHTELRYTSVFLLPMSLSANRASGIAQSRLKGRCVATADLPLGHIRDFGSYEEPSEKFLPPSYQVSQATANNTQIESQGGQVRPIAGGNLFDIYRGEIPNGATVAVKCPRVSVPKEDQFMKMLASELRIWASLKHSSIVPILGTCIFQHRFAFIEPWMKNGNLLDFLKIQPETANRWVQVADGIAFLHDHEIIHGYIQGHNILVSDENGPVLHFAATADQEPRSHCRWMAPELFLPEAENCTKTKAADVYAFGMLNNFADNPSEWDIGDFLFQISLNITIIATQEILTSKMPYHEYKGDFQATVAAIKGIPPIRPSEMGPSTPLHDKRWHLMMQCWNQQPSLRPSAAGIKDMV
ncbi:Tyrosine kinase domain protein [Ceratobasidium sp. AG-Ba]|nr:Tyrosine kinase domain protein [Ceratobasidium sp. AG-Ba]